MAGDWHFYLSTAPPYQEPPQAAPHPCAIPLFAVARDAHRILLVHVLSVETVTAHSTAESQTVQSAKVRLAQIRKGKIPLAPGAVLAVQPSSADPPQAHAAETLAAGKRYIVVPRDAATLPTLQLNFCGVFDDSPEAQQQVKRGLAQNDDLRHKDAFGDSW